MTRDLTGDRRYSRHPELPLLGALSLLVIIGFVAMWSASSGFAIKLKRPADYFATRQALFTAAALGFFILAAYTPLERIRKLSPLLVLVSLFSLTLPFFPVIGVEINGGRRWINLYFTNFQPSELWKPLIVLYAAHILDSKNEKIRTAAYEAIFPFMVVLAGTLVIYLQDDFSTSVIATLGAIAVFWVAGAPFRFFAATAVIAVPAMILMVSTSEYRLIRVLGFLIPDYDPHGMNYQVQNSIRAIMSGGFWGKGLGLGTRKLSTIPEIESDFVFAAFSEEMGLLGVAAVIACWVFVAVSVFKTVINRSPFRMNLAFGLLFLLSIEFLVNLGVVSGLLPATGIALPFFSAGGSSLLSTAIAVGLLVNCSRDEGFAPLPSLDGLQEFGGKAHG